MRRLHNDISCRNRMKLQGKLISWFCSFFFLYWKRWTLVLFSIQYVSQQMGLIKYNTIQIIEFMLSISPTCFGTGVAFLGSLRTRNARRDWQNTSSSCSSRIQFFPFRLIIDLSALWLTVASVRIVVVCVHFLRQTFIDCFLSPTDTFYWPRKLIIVAAKGLGSVAFNSCCISALFFLSEIVPPS
jgi:hypothetical protein